MSTMSADLLGQGWARADSAPGMRNHVLALSTVALTDRLTQLAAAQVDGVLALTPGLSRGLRDPDADLQERVLEALIRHPNTGAVLVVVHDAPAARRMREKLADLARPVQVLAFMACHGYADALDQAVAALRALRTAASQTPRVPLRLADLAVALECGGSDASSAICANPAIGRFVDRLIDAGGTAIVSETAEFVGSEAVIRKQAANDEVVQQILACIAREEAMMAADGQDYRGVNPTAENIEAGLTTLIEKTMGAVSKIGQRPIDGCLGFGQAPSRAGLYFMDTPFFSPASITGMVAAGCQITLFAMGVFNPSGNPLAPTLKICGNPKTLSVWGESIDVDVSGLIAGTTTLDAAAGDIAAAIAACIDGERTATERWQEGQIIIARSLPAL